MPMGVAPTCVSGAIIRRLIPEIGKWLYDGPGVLGLNGIDVSPACDVD